MKRPHFLTRLFPGATATSPWFGCRPQRGRCGSSEKIVVNHHSGWKISGLALFATAALLALPGCADSHASAEHGHSAEPAPAVTYKAGHGLRLSAPALAFAGVGTAEFTGRLPAAALLRTARGNFVYVANDGWLLRTPVKIGPGDGRSFEVRDGLYEGDVVAVSGALALWLAEIQAVNGGVGCADGH